MKYPGWVVMTVLEKMSYETSITITRFPCSATVRQDLADSLVNIGFIELGPMGYRLTTLGEVFLNNSTK
jgi:hypothetical protein